MGDFNFPAIKWCDGFVEDVTGPEYSVEDKFLDTINDCFLYQNFNFSTFQNKEGHTTNTLDLIFSDSKIRLSDILPNPPLGAGQGHLVLKWDIFLADTILSANKHSYPNNFNYNKCDFNKMSSFLGSVDWSVLFANMNSNQMYNSFVDVYNLTCNRFIPVYKTFNVIKGEEWVTKEIKLLLKNKR